MLLTTEHEGTIYAYEENFWTGKRQLSVDGVAATKLSKKNFSFKDKNNRDVYAEIKGSFLTGVSLYLGSGQTLIFYKNKAYETLLIFMPFLYIALGVTAGAIGGGLSAIFAMVAAVFNASILRSKSSLLVKVLGCIGVFTVGFVAFIAAIAAVAGGIALAFPSLFGK